MLDRGVGDKCVTIKVVGDGQDVLPDLRLRPRHETLRGGLGKHGGQREKDGGEGETAELHVWFRKCVRAPEWNVREEESGIGAGFKAVVRGVEYSGGMQGSKRRTCTTCVNPLQ